MSSDNNNSWASPWVRDLVQLITAITALVVALGGIGFGCRNSSRIDEHRDEIKANKQEIDNTADKVHEIRQQVMPKATELAK